MFLIKTCNIHLAWFIFVLTLQHDGGQKAHGWRFDPWQHEVIFKIFEHKKVCVNRCRGGSKTRDMAALAVFFSLRGLEVVWLAANRKQIMAAQKYWREMRFVHRFSIDEKTTMIHLSNGTFFQIFVLKKGLNNDRGSRAHCIFYDEMSQMDDDLVENTRPFSAGADYDGSPIFWIHFSTPEINSTFQTACNSFPTITHDCYYPSWFTQAYIDSVKENLADNKFKQEMLCQFVSMAGSLLEGHIFLGQCPVPVTQYELYGLDPNAREGYCVVGVKYSSDYKYAQIFYVHNFGPNSNGKKLALEFLKERELTKLVRKGQIEMETNGVGMPIYDDYCDDYNGHATPSFWDDKSKIRRINLMTRTKFYIDPQQGKEYSQCYGQLMALSLTQDGTKVDKPTDKQWHLADSAMHAAQGQGMVWA